MLSKSERMQKSHSITMNQLMLKQGVLKRVRSIVESFRLFVRENPEYNQEQYREWYNSVALGRINGAIRWVKTNTTSNTLKKKIYWNVLLNVKGLLTKQLRDKYRYICIADLMTIQLNNMVTGLEDAVSRHEKKWVDLKVMNSFIKC